MEAVKEEGEVGGATERKRVERLVPGEDHDWFVLEAERMEPAVTEEVVAAMKTPENTRVRNRFET